jgi:hypothetical protein
LVTTDCVVVSHASQRYGPTTWLSISFGIRTPPCVRAYAPVLNHASARNPTSVPSDRAPAWIRQTCSREWFKATRFS